MDFKSDTARPKPASDPVTTEVIGSALISIVEEMAKAIIKSAYSTNIKEREDCSTVIFDRKGQIIAQAERIPVHLGSLLGIADWVLTNVDLSTVEPGDVFIGNDAYTGGGTHLNDIVFMEPVFYDGELVAWISNLAHHSDFVDRGHAHIFQEGLRIPPVRLYRAGVLQQDILDFVLLNCQVPHERRNDFRAQMAANRLGVQRYIALCQKYGEGVVSAASDEILDYADRKTRSGIAQIANGTYAYECTFDTPSYEPDLHLKVKVTITDDEMHFDLRDNPKQVRAGVNMVYTATLATVYFAVKALVDPDIPPNAGFHRAIHVDAEKGTVFNSESPGAVYTRTDIGQRLVDMILAALAPAIPERICSASSGGGLMTFSGTHPRTGKFFVYNEMCGGSMGARATKDGLDGVQVHTTNTGNIPIEALEYEHPVMVERYELVTDSGGAGQWRGGMTIRRQVRLVGDEATINVGGTLTRNAPWGLFGGQDGRTTNVELGEGVAPLQQRRGTLSDGQSVAMVAASGGGYGDPKKRDRDLVRRDLKEGRISLEAARTVYGLDV
ncbi:hydantoinase B/oxoprolinase family protein [Salipiger mucosus]|nr:hydantoinase B/oxoprolinase family protein [Salipiger mucosus]